MSLRHEDAVKALITKAREQPGFCALSMHGRREGMRRAWSLVWLALLRPIRDEIFEIDHFTVRFKNGSRLWLEAFEHDIDTRSLRELELDAVIADGGVAAAYLILARERVRKPKP